MQKFPPVWSAFSENKSPTQGTKGTGNKRNKRYRSRIVFARTQTPLCQSNFLWLFIAADKPDRPFFLRHGRGHQFADGIEHLLELGARVACKDVVLHKRQKVSEIFVECQRAKGVGVDLCWPIKIEGPREQCLHHFRKKRTQSHIRSEDMLSQPTLQKLDMFIRHRFVCLKDFLLQLPHAIN